MKYYSSISIFCIVGIKTESPGISPSKLCKFLIST